ncbi:hypothetical protein P692DRAFT_201805750 [Suillus brevipes Sb2]|nr:hypothetical protein P692DRAFT_201805750 [Suillus brevipes Sb2]
MRKMRIRTSDVKLNVMMDDVGECISADIIRSDVLGSRWDFWSNNFNKVGSSCMCADGDSVCTVYAMVCFNTRKIARISPRKTSLSRGFTRSKVGLKQRRLRRTMTVMARIAHKANVTEGERSFRRIRWDCAEVTWDTADSSASSAWISVTCKLEAEKAEKAEKANKAQKVKVAQKIVNDYEAEVEENSRGSKGVNPRCQRAECGIKSADSAGSNVVSRGR